VKITPEELKSKIENKEDFFLLDVRTEEEHKIAKIPNSYLIPLNELLNRITEVPKNKEIIIYCHHGIRSAQAAEFLKSKNFTNVKSLVGGINAFSNIVTKIPKY